MIQFELLPVEQISDYSVTIVERSDVFSMNQNNIILGVTRMTSLVDQ